jgi:hypothetical protein
VASSTNEAMSQEQREIRKKASKNVDQSICMHHHLTELIVSFASKNLFHSYVVDRLLVLYEFHITKNKREFSPNYVLVLYTQY